MKTLASFICILLFYIQNTDAGYYIDNYYVSHPLKMTWWEASRFCTFYGNQLIDIPDEREYRKILTVIQKVQQNDSSIANTSIWTSGNRFPEEKTYYWESTGMPIIYADWVPGDPQMRKDEKCLFMWQGGNWKLADGTCTDKCSFICRVPQTAYSSSMACEFQ